MNVRTRIAPSPTGENLHIGNAYTALVNYVFAKKYGGEFIIRIEDTDRTRLVEGSEKRILESLKWLGIKYAEGPDIGGPYIPYRQSERLDIYKKYSGRLVENGKAYYCFCSPQRLDEMRKLQEKERKPTIDDGLCKKIDIKDAKKRVQNGEKYVIRLNVPEEGITEFSDIIRGKISFENRLIDDQVLIKSDGFPTYHFGVVVDDHLMEISHVIRGEEWISSVPKHILLYKAFGWEMPLFAHLPLLRSPDKSKLSKRKNPVWVSWYKEQGFIPEALLNYLALMGWSMPDGRDKFTIDDMIKEFKLEDIKTTAPIFDIEKLKWLNKRHIQELSTEEYFENIRNCSKFSKEGSFKTIVTISETLVKPRISNFWEFDHLAEFYFQSPKIRDIDLSKYKTIMEGVIEELKQLDNRDWKAQLIGEKLQTSAKASGLSNSEFFMIIRIAVTGKRVSPPLNESMEILGKEEILKRLSMI